MVDLTARRTDWGPALGGDGIVTHLTLPDVHHSFAEAAEKKRSKQGKGCSKSAEKRSKQGKGGVGYAVIWRIYGVKEFWRLEKSIYLIGMVYKGSLRGFSAWDQLGD
jgi:hypothetical protein